MKKRRYLILVISFLLTAFLVPVYFQSEAFHQFYSKHLREKYLPEVNDGTHWLLSDWELTLKDMVRMWDMCAVVTVTEGMEDSLGSKWKKDPKQIWDATYDDIKVTVESYLYDKSENYFEQLILRDQTNWGKTKRIYAYSGERLIIFMDVLGSGLCQAPSWWGYIITEKNYLVPLTDRLNEKMNDYGGRKAETYTQTVKKEWELYRMKRNYQYAIGNRILEVTGETDWTKARCGFRELKTEPGSEPDTTFIALLFLQKEIDEQENYLEVPEREGVMELILKQNGIEYEVLSCQTVFCEELEEKKVSLSFSTQSELEKLGYPSKEVQEELFTAMGVWNTEVSLDLQCQEVYDLFTVWHDKLEERNN